MMKPIRIVLQGERGVTLLELAVVAAILAILAALAAAGVTGQVLGARGNTIVSNITEVQNGVDGYRSDHPSGRFPTVDGDLRIDGNIAILFSSSFITAEGETKSLVPDFFQRNPKDAFDCAADLQIVGSISEETTDPNTDCSSRFPVSVPVWQLDEDGLVVNNLDERNFVTDREKIRILAFAYWEAFSLYDEELALSYLEEGFRLQREDSIRDAINELKALQFKLVVAEDTPPQISGTGDGKMFVLAKFPEGTSQIHMVFLKIDGEWRITDIQQLD